MGTPPRAGCHALLRDGRGAVILRVLTLVLRYFRGNWGRSVIPLVPPRPTLLPAAAVYYLRMGAISNRLPPTSAAILAQREH